MGILHAVFFFLRGLLLGRSALAAENPDHELSVEIVGGNRKALEE